MITKIMEKLVEYDTKVKWRIDDCKYHESDIQKGKNIIV